MEDNKSFLDELLDEVESKETTLHLAHVDLILGEISNLEEQIATNFEQTEKEIQILNDWTLRKNSKLQERIDWMSRKLEAFMKDQGENVKTIELPNGKLLRRKQPTRLEITNMDEFMKNENLYQLGTLQPEILKPNLNMIKAFINMSRRIPMGVKVIEGIEKFSIKLNNNKEQDNGETEVRTEINKPTHIKLLYDEPIVGESQYGKYFLYAVSNGNGHEYSLFAHDSVHDVLKACPKGTEAIITKLAAQRGKKLVTTFSTEIVNGSVESGIPNIKQPQTNPYLENMLQSFEDAIKVQEKFNGMANVNQLAVTMFIQRTKSNGLAT